MKFVSDVELQKMILEDQDTTIFVMLGVNIMVIICLK